MRADIIGAKALHAKVIDESVLLHHFDVLEVLVHNNFDQNPVSQKFVSNFDTENFS